MLICFSSSHQNMPLSLLDAINIREEEAFISDLLSEGVTKECVLLQTCHRVEIYCMINGGEKEKSIKQVERIWGKSTGVSLDIVSRHAEIFQERDAMKHLFFLTCGLKSMIMGEDQILGQVRDAFLKAKKRGNVGLVLDRVFMKAINVGKRVRTETKINEGAISISSAAVDLGAKELGNLSSKKVLVIGAGKAGALVAEALRVHSVSKIIIANKTYSRGNELAEKVSGVTVPFENVFEAVNDADFTIAAISTSKPLLTKEKLSSYFGSPLESKGKLFIDISQPRAIENEVASIPGVKLRTIDDLNQIISGNLRNRMKEAEKCKETIFQELTHLELELSKLIAQPLINSLCRNFDEIRKKELQRAIRKMGESDKRKLDILERFSMELIERVSKVLIDQLKKAALNGDAKILSAAEKLFQQNDTGS